MSKKSNSFCQTYIKFAVARSTSKMMNTIDISRFPRRVNEQLLKFFSPQSNLSIQNFEKTLNESHDSTKLSTSLTWSKPPNHLIKFTEFIYLFSLMYLQCSKYFYSAWRVCSRSSETPWAGRWIWPQLKHLSAGIRLNVHKTTTPEKKADQKIRKQLLLMNGPLGDRASLYV